MHNAYKKCPSLSDPMDCSLPGSSVHGLFQARVLEWGAIAFSIGNLGYRQREKGVKCEKDSFMALY